jgi:hypothetical protein
VEANADRNAKLPQFYVDAVNEHLGALFPATANGAVEEPIPIDLMPILLPVDLVLEMAADQAAKNSVRHDWIAELGRPDRHVTHGYYQRHADIWVNTTDPVATLMHRKGGGNDAVGAAVASQVQGA